MRATDRSGGARPAAIGVAALPVNAVAYTGSTQHGCLALGALTIAVGVAAAVVGRVTCSSGADCECNEFAARAIERRVVTVDGGDGGSVCELRHAQSRLRIAKLCRFTIPVYRARAGGLAQAADGAHARAASGRGIELRARPAAIGKTALGVDVVAHAAPANHGRIRAQARTGAISESALVVRRVAYRAAAHGLCHQFIARTSQRGIMSRKAGNRLCVRQLGRASMCDTLAKLRRGAVAVHGAGAHLLTHTADRAGSGATHGRCVLHRARAIAVRVAALVIVVVARIAPTLPAGVWLARAVAILVSATIVRVVTG